MSFSVLFKMKCVLVLALTLIVGSVAQVFDISDSMRNCINCICHMRSGCYSRFNCAKYSISKDYWEMANKPKINDNDDDTKGYQNCMKNEDCIVQTIINYSERLDEKEKDCNCDGVFNCLDRAAIHMNKCYDFTLEPKFVNRFNECAKETKTRHMLMKENKCDVEDV